MKKEVYEGYPQDTPDEAWGGSQAVEAVDGVVSLDPARQLQRGLKSRHIQFLALGGA